MHYRYLPEPAPLIAPWNNDIWQSLTQRRARHTHAWLLSGPEGLGKLELAMDYARDLVGQPAIFEAASHPDLHVLTPESLADAEGTLPQRYGMRYSMTKKGVKPRSVIAVDQVRALVAALVTYAYGTNKVILITPAHRMNVNAANALLKILEEPPSATIFILVSSEPDALSATVRSRCSRIQFKAPPTRVALNWLAEHAAEGGDPSLALSIAGGAPLLAARMLQSGFLQDRGQVISDIQGVLTGALDVAAVAAKWKDLGLDLTLPILRGLLIDLTRVGFQAQPPYLFNPDQLNWLQGSVKRLHLKRVFPLIDRIGSYLKDTSAPLDKNLVLEDFLLELGGITRHEG